MAARSLIELDLFNTFAITLMILLILFNIHIILFIKERYLLTISNGVRMYNKNLVLDSGNLLSILLVVVFLIFFIHLQFYSNQFIGFVYSLYGTNTTYIQILEVFMFNYLLTFLFFTTAAVHIWLNLSIVYPIYINFCRTKSIDFLDLEEQRFLRMFVAYLTKISFLYVLLSVGTFFLYRIDLDNILERSIQLEPILLLPFIFFVVTINLLFVLRINSLSHNFLYEEYAKAYHKLEDYSDNIDSINNKILILEKVIEPLTIKKNISIFVWQIISLVITLISIIQKFMLS